MILKIGRNKPVRHADVFLAVSASVVFDDGPLLLASPGTLGAIEVPSVGFFLQKLEPVLHCNTCKLLKRRFERHSLLMLFNI